MAQLLPETEATVFEDRTYVNPNTTVDETNAFIDNYRNLQQTNTDKIISDTHDLGTDVTSNLGGLTGSGSYWKNRYQTPQTSSAVADLRATAQAAALNTALENEKNAWTKRYNDAYRNYQKKSWNKSNTTSGGGGDDKKLETDTNPDDGGKTEVSLDTGGKYEKSHYYATSDTTGDYQDANGQWWKVSNPTWRDTVFGPTSNPLAKRTNENVMTVNGKKFIYLDNIPNAAASWYVVEETNGPGTY